MAFFGFFIALWLFLHYKRRLRYYRRQHRVAGARLGAVSSDEADMHDGVSGSANWHAEWQRQWAEKFQQQAERRRCQFEKHTQRRLRRLDREARRFGFSIVDAARREAEKETVKQGSTDDTEVLRRARRRA